VHDDSTWGRRLVRAESVERGVWPGKKRSGSPGLVGRDSAREEEAAVTGLTLASWCRQRHHGHPELIDGSYNGLELNQVQGFFEVAVRLERIARLDIDIVVRDGQNGGRDRFESRVPLNDSQELSAIHSGHIQIKQDKIGARRIGMLSLLPQEGQRINAVGCHMQMNGVAGVAEGFLHQPNIARIIFDEQNLQRLACSSNGSHI
jgi:hypothetical protein